MRIVLKLKPYNERSDLEKIQSQWRKLSGLHSKEEWSAAVVRAATAAEIAANFAIRESFASKGQFSPKFVDGLLIWANGIAGKIERLLIPIHEGSSKGPRIRALHRVAKRINVVRNDIVHRGAFADRSKARAAIADARKFITSLVGVFDSEFRLKGELD